MRKVLAIAAALLLMVATNVITAQRSSALTASVTITATAASNGTTTLTYGATATAAGTLKYIDVTLPPGTGGSVTSINGIVRTVVPGTLRWVPTKIISIRVGSRFSIPFYGLRLPSGGPWTLSFKAVSTTGARLSYGTAVLGGSTPSAPNVLITATNPVPGATTTMTYAGSITTPGVLTKVVMELPPGSSGRVSTVNGTLTSSGGYLTWTANAPITVRVGSRLSIPVYGLHLSVYGGNLTLQMSARTGTGGILMSGRGTIALIAPPATMPAVSMTSPFPNVAPGCPSTWPTTAQENAKPGSSAWVIPTSTLSDDFKAYLSEVSAACGDTVAIKVDSGRPVSIVAYRMGYYAGLGAREVWRRDNVPTVQQPAPIVGGTDAQGNNLNMVSAKNWSTTLRIAIDDTFVPGTYLFSISDGTYATYAPLTVRDDGGTKHDVLIQQGTTTWAAYNTWGGYSFYRPRDTGSARLSFDRPYDGDGSGQYLQLEHGLAYWAESKNLDVTYWTDNDLDQFGAQVPLRAKNLFLPGHDEYYTPTMRAALSQAIDRGTNIANLGANTVYRRMWFTDDSRREWDIDRFTDGYYSTLWRNLGDAYASQPLLGAEYRCALPGDPMTTGSSWLYEGITPGTTIPGFIAGEVDRVDPNLYRHPSLAVVGSGVGTCRGTTITTPMHITTYTAASGARVFNGSSFAYGCFAGGSCASSWTVPNPPIASQRAVGLMLANITKWVSKGTVVVSSTMEAAATPMKVKPQQQPLPLNDSPADVGR